VFRPIRLHQSWVTDIQWSNDNLRLVSVGDKMAWQDFWQFYSKQKHTFMYIGMVPCSRGYFLAILQIKTKNGPWRA
jgi:hypothetical protein